MRKLILPAMSLTAGIVVGSVVTILMLQKKNREKLAQERNVLWRHYADQIAAKTELATEELHEELERVNTELSKAKDELRDRDILKNIASTEQEVKTSVNENAFIIRPDEFGTIPDYDRFYYTYCEEDGKFYIDGNRENPACEEEIGDMFRAVHPEDHFGEYEDDAVYLRNDDLHTDIAVYLAEETTEETEE